MVTVNVPVRLALPTSAVIVTLVAVVTALVLTVKFTEVRPAGTVTTGCGEATGLLVDNVASAPPAGAGLLSRSVPIVAVPPTTLAGLNVTPCRMGGAFGSGLTSTKIDLVTPPALAKIFPPVGKIGTELVPTAKLTALLPSGIVTLAGT